MANQDPLIGQKFGDYIIQTLLGKGGMARVYRALDPNLDRTAAIKVIDPGVAGDPEYARRFKREAQAVAKLNHPNIVSIYQFGEMHGIYYMAMAFIDGADLAHVIKQHRHDRAMVSYDAVLRVAGQIGAALDYAHSQGVIHRDVKPGNILVTAQGRAILTDFGLVRDIAIPTLGEIFGSPDYISPEQAVNSAKAVPQSDLYSLGVALYELLAGRLPFEHENPNEVALMHIGTPVPPLRQFNPSIPPGVETVIMKSIAKRVEARYQTGAELFNALRQAVKMSTVTGIRTG
ncbi:MAG: serine/threonine-protein kinase [Aggregatilineales bacterium]